MGRVGARPWVPGPGTAHAIRSGTMATTTATELREPTSFTALEIRELRLEDLERFARTGKKLALREWLALAEAWRRGVGRRA